MATIAAEPPTESTRNKRKSQDISSDSEENCFNGDDIETSKGNPTTLDAPTTPTTKAKASSSSLVLETAKSLISPSLSDALKGIEKNVTDKQEEPEILATKESLKNEAPTSALQDAANNSSVPPPNFPLVTTTPNEYDKICWKVITNDGSEASLIKLVGLKSLFAKQLPKMPRAYIARLVFDRSHTSLAILSDQPSVRDTDDEIIGAICYRPVLEQRFAEIAFCAVNANYQVKGYGTKLMNLLKQQAVRDGIEYFITYADDYAIGYFKKQGFTKTITMPKGRYYRLIKEYDGATPMECYIHPSIDFTRINEMVEAQRQYILQRILLRAQSPHCTYKPRPISSANATTSVRPADLVALPGVAEAGWTIPDFVRDNNNSNTTGPHNRAALKQELQDMVRKICEQQYAWPFREPVDTKEVHDYLDVIQHPMDLKTMEKKIKQDAYKTKQMLWNDIKLMVENCKLYNEDGSPYIQCAVKVENFCKTLFKDILS